jgi:hypothetical protein
LCALRGPFDFAQGRPLKRRSSTGLHDSVHDPRGSKSRPRIKIKIKITVKGSGQECPLHTCGAVAAGLVPFPVVRCWFAPHDVQGGMKLHEQIYEAIRRYKRLLLILSPNSMSSKWVKTEIRNARKREVAEKKRVLFPVRLASYEALRE